MLIFLIITLLFTRLYALFNAGALFYQFEGLYCGWMAKELLDGASLWSIFNSSYFPAQGGSVVIVYITSFFFSIFGDSFFSLVLTPILFSILISISFFLVLNRYFNRNVAIIFVFLFIFSPPKFLNFSLFAIGGHFESILFTIMSLFCFFEIFFNEKNYKAYVRKTPHRKLHLIFIIFGLISGFGVYFFYDQLIMLFTIILFWFFIDRKFFLKRYFFVFLLGFIIGFLPWLIYNTAHNFSGLRIHNLKLFEILFSKNIGQIFQTFNYIITNKLPAVLGTRLYLTIVFSFVLIAFLNFSSIKDFFSFRGRYSSKTKELVFICYVLVFIATWSILYLPIGKERVSSWMSGLWGRLFHVVPFLFVSVALCFNKFLPLKKDKNYFLKIAISSIFTIWILNIGFSNYSNAISTSESKMRPLEIKGYSARIAYSRKKPTLTIGFLEQDMINVSKATKIDNRLWPVFFMSFANRSSKLAQEITEDNRLDDFKKPYYYLTIGLNTGDLTEGYNILSLNNVTIKKIPIQYRHYFYEGAAFSLMNRRRDEIMKNIDFIEKIPMEYRHYFLLELGRVIGSYPDDKIKQEKLQYSIKRFPGIYESYICRGLVESLANEDYLKNQHKNNIQKEEFPYLYRAIARRFFRELPSENVIFDSLKKYAIDKDNERYFYWGIAEGFFKKDCNVYQEDVIKNKIETIVKCNWTNKGALCEGLGLTLGHLTFGYIKRFIGPLENSLNSNLLSSFYYGYSTSLKERYGMDVGRMKELIDNNIPEGFKKRCYYAIERQDS